ncbi:U2 small nuclear ribonucleoprotein A'-like [Cucurbita maxima]|uniref:U2 small nuclear ribonucleoprotein A'-like n=1 Tax=Cucurbita maxima TaxID=3661 RepID=A0A6J1JRX0_CUCMA|nr:U2 small nuclear ribonucleoprotein A'-like [Cucurbita maxima]
MWTSRVPIHAALLAVVCRRALNPLTPKPHRRPVNSSQKNMVRPRVDLIWKSPHFFNAIKERELDLRGNKIAVIENLGATEDQFDGIDLCDNEIVKLEIGKYALS